MLESKLLSWFLYIPAAAYLEIAWSDNAGFSLPVARRAKTGLALSLCPKSVLHFFLVSKKQIQEVIKVFAVISVGR